MNVSELPTLLGLRKSLTIRLSCDHAMFGRRFELNVTADERSWLGKRLEVLRKNRDPYLGQIESSAFQLECRPSPLGSLLGRISVQGTIRQVGGLTILEGIIDGFRTWKTWMIANAVFVAILCIGLAATAAEWPNKGLVLMAFFPGVATYLAISAGILFFLTSRETERLLTELEKDLKEWVR
ncbi:MAG: hypothetical protein IPK50_19640 [Fibrobacterota bacterium]|nr:hypothetical protein [Fibrobacterota bacterium]QQS04478.1 MAG: hypothetical protein IPK50_19640 [Fibrobacterota bacterium]